MKKLLIGVAAMLLLNSCSLMPAEEELPKAPIKKANTVVEYSTSEVTRMDLSLTQLVNCSYRPAGSQQVTYQVGGETLAAVYVSIGESVTEGQLLGELSMGSLETDLQAAELTLQQSKLDISYLKDSWALTEQSLQLQMDDLSAQMAELSALMENAGEEEKAGYTQQKTMLQNNLTSLQNSLASQKNNHEASLRQKQDAKYIAEKRLAELQAEKRARQLYAGMDGNISYLTTLSEGDKVYENGTFATISNLDTSVFSVKGEDAVFFPVGETVTVDVRDTLYEAVSVSAEALGLEFEENTAYLQLTDPLATLEDGTNGQITVVQAFSENALAVPRNAVLYRGEQTVVFCLDEEGEKVPKDVTVGITTKEGFTEIISGLSAGETVVLEQEER